MKQKRNYNDPVYSRWRKEVYKRDGHRCQMPSCKARKHLQVHHIRKWSEASSMRYDVSNGITLCWRCHKDVTGSEAHFEGLFISIVAENAKRT